jgi:hypothetical protein
MAGDFADLELRWKEIEACIDEETKGLSPHDRLVIAAQLKVKAECMADDAGDEG